MLVSELEISSKRLIDVTHDEQNVLDKLTLHQEGCNDSWMYSKLRTREWEKRPARAIIARLCGKVVGWAIIIKMKHDLFVATYVHPEQRRKGVGRSLIREVKKIKKRYWSKLTFYARPWDKRGRLFYTKTLSKKYKV